MDNIRRRAARTCRAGVITIGCVVTTSCASLIGTFDDADYPENKVYIGVRSDWQMITSEGGMFSDLFMPIGIVDLPFSFVCDSLLLPYTIPYTVFYR